MSECIHCCSEEESHLKYCKVRSDSAISLLCWLCLLSAGERMRLSDASYAAAVLTFNINSFVVIVDVKAA